VSGLEKILLQQFTKVFLETWLNLEKWVNLTNTKEQKKDITTFHFWLVIRNTSRPVL